MVTKVIMPKLGLTMTEGVVLKWLKSVGEKVTQGEPLLEVQTEKITNVVEAPASGYLVKITANENEKVPVLEEIGLIAESLDGIESVAADMQKPAEKAPVVTEEADMLDVVVIGGGPGGYVAAIRAAQLGGKVALVERNLLGGTCLNLGCIPTKTILRSTEVLWLLRNAERYGIKAGGVTFDLKAIAKRVDEVVANLRTGVNYLLNKNKVTTYKGSGSLKDANTVEIALRDGKVEMLKTKNIIIASGSKVLMSTNVTPDGDTVITSDEALKLNRVPDRLLVIGGGTVGIEFSSIYNRLGANTTLVEMMPQLIPNGDREVAVTLKKDLVRQGIDVKVSTRVNILEHVAGAIKVELEVNGNKETVDVDMVLVATGRVPETVGLKLDSVGIKTECGRISVDEHLRTNVVNIYAIGDVIGGIMLAHMASAEGIVAAENAMGKDSKIYRKAVPMCVYCEPEVASVGLSEEMAREKGYSLHIGKFPFSANGKAMAYGETEGFVKIVAEKKYGEILGVHIIGPHATDMIQEAVLAIQNELTYEEIGKTIHAHPTLSEVLMEAAHDVEKISIHKA